MVRFLSLTPPGGAVLTLLVVVLSLGPIAVNAQESRSDSLEHRRVSSMTRSLPLMSNRALGPIQPDTVQARRFDNGKMWTFDAPPVDYFREAYDFAPDSTWFERARLGALRIPGCTASFASAHGLALTNHHCARDHATAVGQPDEDLLQNGFYAASVEDERRVPELYADQLIDMRDVTDQVEAAVTDAETPAERIEARQSAIQRIQQEMAERRGGEEAGIHVEVIPLYNGAQYSAYVFRRYDDVRLVMIPELQIGYFGGDTDNFTYPRYALDMALFRVYEDGVPMETEHYFSWAEAGSASGDPVFVVGNPGSTLRLETVAQLEFRRDVQEPAVLGFLESRAEALQAYVDAEDDPSAALQNRIFSLRNGVKLYRGRVEALNDPYVMARRQSNEQALQDSLQAAPSLRTSHGGLIDSMATIQDAKREYAAAHQAFLLLDNPNYSSATLRRAFLARQYLDRQAQGGPAEAPLEQLRQNLLDIEAQPEGIDRRFLVARIRDVQSYLGENHAIVREALQGESPDELAEHIIQTSVLADSAQTAAALADDGLSSDDPAVQLAEALHSLYQEYRSAWAGLDARQREIARQLGQARFAIYGTNVPPDATFSLRLADGVVRGYAYNGTEAPPRTTFYGLYAHYASHGQDSEWDLPSRWLEPPDTFDRSTPVNLVTTNDITGGNSGSPLLNRDLELVGLVFDGNIEGLVGDYMYMPDQGMRAVSVDVRGMLEALEEIYDADRIVLEVTDGPFVESEAAADAEAEAPDAP